MIAGILRPTGGKVEVGGVDVVADPVAAKSKLGFIPDRPFIYEKLTGAEFPRGSSPACTTSRDRTSSTAAARLLALFDLEAWRDEMVES